eukprot:gnl/MRDRNA2_/MRDRNA2_105772_c0_seq1.p1 gnl/MRDRNA2_/MRDRNA2_105772_c0~~gnl/MRDRNA2_/MRDRNA2_105772_c0_seq1.p1  ORF type:complete len:447 (-),score=38.33 gnl/MRDRNA2_/MRDRNA2_105772_c0_seq1:96-1436(-)
MIVYSKGWGGCSLLCQLRGTSWPHAIFPALISTCFGVIIGALRDFNTLVETKELFMVHPYPFQLYAFVVGFLIVFRTNFAYQRYWEGRSTIAQMDGKLLDGACMAITFDATGDSSTPFLDGIKSRPSVTQSPTRANSPSHEQFFEEITHLFSLMHALALQHLRQDSDLANLKGFKLMGRRVTALPDAPMTSGADPDIKRVYSAVSSPSTRRDVRTEIYKHQTFQVIGGISEAEIAALKADAEGKPILSGARVAMVEGWIMRRLIARQKHESSDMGQTSPPILSRLYQVVSDGALGFSQASKIIDTPFPFPYQNLIHLFLCVYGLIVPFVMNAWLRNVYLRAVLTFLATWSYFAMHQVGSNLEDPYLPYDPNELALTSIHHDFNSKLLAFGIIPTEVPPLPVEPAEKASGASLMSDVNIEENLGDAKECEREPGAGMYSSSSNVSTL